MISFRQKITLIYGTFFVLFLLTLLPFIGSIVKTMTVRVFYENSLQVLKPANQFKTEKEFIDYLKSLKSKVFFRLSLINPEKQVVYDSHLQALLGDAFNHDLVVNHKEVIDAFDKGKGYEEAFSTFFDQKFAYVATSFEFLGKKYVLREAFPFGHVTELTDFFERSLIILSVFALLIFGLISWFIMDYLTAPIRKILRDLNSYYADEKPKILHIDMSSYKDSDEFVKLAKTLNAFSVKTKKLIDVQREFVANASHELKTPITILTGLTEVLQGDPGLPPEKKQELTHKMMQNCARMQKIIKNLIALTRIEDLPIESLQTCNLKEIVEKAKITLQEVYKEALFNSTYNHQETFEMMGDANLLEHLFLNLMDNGVKYSKNPATVTIDLKREGENLIAKVIDKGIGIPKEDLEHVFERFYTVDKAHSKKLGGSGLGLSIVEAIVEKHHGSIAVESILQQGTIFTITFKQNKI